MSLAVLLIAAAAFGTWLVWPMRIPVDLEGKALRLMVGVCACAAVIVGAGSASLLLAEILLMAGGIAGIISYLMVRPKRTGPEPAGSAPPLDWIEYTAVAATAAALLLAFLSALAPVTGWDATVAHMALPADYVRAGRLLVFEGNAYSAYPHLMHALYTFALLGGVESDAVLVNWTFAFLGCLIVFALGRRLAGRRAGLLAMAVFATSPVFFDQAGTASLDLAFAVITLGAVTALVAWRDEHRLSWVALAGILAGSSCGVRHTGYLVCVLLCVAVAGARGPGRAWAAGLFTACTAAAAAPWLLRSAILAGNPVYPFFASVFSPDAIAELDVSAVGSHESLRGTGLVDLVAFPWRLIMWPDYYDGWSKSPGALALLLGVPGVIVGGKRARWLAAYCAAGVACLFFYRQYARYYLPFFLPMMVLAGVAACRLRTLRKPVAVLLAVTFAYGLVLDVAAVHFKIPVALGFESRDHYLTRRVERYPAFQWVNKEIGPSGRLLFTLDPRSYYIHTPTYQNQEELRPLIGASIDEQAEWFRARHIRYLLYPKAYIESSPGYRQDGFLAMFDAWRADPERFVLIERFELERPRAGGTEVVEIYEIP